MRFYYEYKLKNGCKIGGHNLEKIIINENSLLLVGIDYIKIEGDLIQETWHICEDFNELKYLKINPMWSVEHEEKNR